MNMRLYLIVPFALFMFWACEDEMDAYNWTDNSLNFTLNEYLTDTVIHKTMVYSPVSRQRDTVWLEVETSGYIVGYSRQFCLKQLVTGESDAVPGVHYVPLEDPAIRPYYVIPAYENRVKVPVVFLRDASMLLQEYALRLAIDKNEYFKNGIKKYQVRTLFISDILVRPKFWNKHAVHYFAGEYGKVKHRFMIDVAASVNTVLDERFFENLVGDPSKVDKPLTNYWNLFFKEKLREENAKRAQNGLEPLREKPEPGTSVGVLVSFDV